MQRAVEQSVDGLISIELSNERGDSVEVMNLGGIIHRWETQSASGEPVNIVLGYPHLQSYLKDPAYHGAIVGRYCNRISRGRFSLHGTTYQLETNEGKNHLHGGDQGLHRRIWAIEDVQKNSVSLSLHSEAGDQGYPGNLQIGLTYTLDEEGELDITWEAASDEDTIVSLTSHGYFNLSGSGDILDHYVRIPADHYTPIDDAGIPSGELRAVNDSVFDLRHFTRLAEVVSDNAAEIRTSCGLDHNYALGRTGEFKLCAQLVSPLTGLLLDVYSTLPGLQCYSGNHLQKFGVHGSHEGICLEAQHYPDSPNQPHFPAAVLRQGDCVRHHIRYSVSPVDVEQLLDTVASHSHFARTS